MRLRADLERLVGLPDLDALRHQVLGEPRRKRRIDAGNEHVLAHAGLLALGHRAPAILGEVAQQLRAVHRSGVARS